MEQTGSGHLQTRNNRIPVLTHTLHFVPSVGLSHCFHPREFATLTSLRQQHRQDSWGVALIRRYAGEQASLNSSNHSHIPDVRL